MGEREAPLHDLTLYKEADAGWDEPVPKTLADARRLAELGKTGFSGTTEPVQVEEQQTPPPNYPY